MKIVYSDYSIWDRCCNDGTEISEDRARDILRSAECYSGPYGGMGKHIDSVLYAEYEEYAEEGEEAEAEAEEAEYAEAEPRLVAVRYNGKWITIPDGQSSQMAFELVHDDYSQD